MYDRIRIINNIIEERRLQAEEDTKKVKEILSNKIEDNYLLMTESQSKMSTDVQNQFNTFNKEYKKSLLKFKSDFTLIVDDQQRKLGIN